MASLEASGEAIPAARLQRGFSRLAVCLAVSWFAFWSFAYVLRPHTSENMPFPGASLPPGECAVLVPLFVAAAALWVRWILAGFRAR